MDIKINKLKDYLPKILVDHSAIYSILSFGLHELSEDECLKYFESVKMGIEIILDDEIKRKEEEEKVKNLTNEMSRIKGEIKSRDCPGI